MIFDMEILVNFAVGLLALIVLSIVVRKGIWLYRWAKYRKEPMGESQMAEGPVDGLTIAGRGNEQLGKLSLTFGNPDRLITIGTESGIAIYLDKKLLLIGNRAFYFSDILRYEPIDDVHVAHGGMEAKTYYNIWGRRVTSGSTYYKMRENRISHDCSLVIMVKDLLRPQVLIRFGNNRRAMYEVMAVLEYIKSDANQFHN